MILKHIDRLKQEHAYFLQEAQKRRLVLDAIYLVETLNALGNEGDVIEMDIGYDTDERWYDVLKHYNVKTKKAVTTPGIHIIEEFVDNLYNNGKHRFTVCKENPQDLMKILLKENYAYFHQLLLEEQLPENAMKPRAAKI